MVLKDKTYTILKWITLICIPAIATFINVVFPVWHLPYADEIVTTINALALLIGTIIGISARNLRGEE